MNTTAQCIKTVILSNLEREYVITGLLLKEIRFFGIDNNGYKFKQFQNISTFPNNNPKYVRCLEVNTCYLPYTQSKYINTNILNVISKASSAYEHRVSALWQSSRERSLIDSEERNLKGHQNVKTSHKIQI